MHKYKYFLIFIQKAVDLKKQKLYTNLALTEKGFRRIYI